MSYRDGPSWALDIDYKHIFLMICIRKLCEPEEELRTGKDRRVVDVILGSLNLKLPYKDYISLE